ncbi:unnamed protein product, partial [Closterium sp. NIES-54]
MFDIDILSAEDVRAPSALSGKCCDNKGKESKTGRVAVGVVVVVEAVEAVEVVGVVAAVRVVAGVGASVAAVVAAVGVGVAVVAAVGVVAAGVVADGVELSGVDIIALDYDAILAAMYALSVSAEGDCYLCLPFDPAIEAAALGASESSFPGTAPAEALHTFTLDSGASRCFFRDSTTLTPLPAPVLVRLGDPSGGPVLARSSTVLSCTAVPSGSLLSCGTTALVTPPCHAFVACTPASFGAGGAGAAGPEGARTRGTGAAG